MGGKMKLDIESVQVSTFETGAAESLAGTVKAYDGASLPHTVELTTPCCGSQVTCPSAVVPCPVATGSC